MILHEFGSIERLHKSANRPTCKLIALYTMENRRQVCIKMKLASQLRLGQRNCAAARADEAVLSGCATLDIQAIVKGGRTDTSEEVRCPSTKCASTHQKRNLQESTLAL